MSNSGRRIILIAAGLAVLAAAAVAGVATVGRQPAEVALPALPPSAGDRAQHMPFGPIDPPAPLPDVDLVLDDGTRSTLADATAGRLTFLQLVFVSCSTTCPLQGAIFGATEDLIDDPGVMLLSVSIDPIGDTPATMRRWMDDHGGGPRWRSAVPDLDDLGPLLDATGARSDDGAGVDVHDSQVYLLDPEGRLVFVTEDLPDPAALSGLVREYRARSEGAS